MFFLFGFGRRSLIGHVLYGVRSALLVGIALYLVPVFLDIERPPRRPAPPPVQEIRGGDARGGDLTGRVTHVRDGDTVEIEDIAVRIANLDCPERGTDAGWRATQKMYLVAKEGPLSCRLSGRRSHDREVGTCQLSDGRDVGQILIDQGVCGPWR